MEEVQAMLMILLQALIAALVPVVTAYAVSWARAQRQLLLSRLSAEHRYLVETVVRQLVQAAEQAGVVGLIENTGAAKKQWVIGQAQRELNNLGLSGVDVDILANAIEAAINQGLHKQYPMLVSAPIDE